MTDRDRGIFGYRHSVFAEKSLEPFKAILGYDGWHLIVTHTVLKGHD
jgi:hypothetical protein